MGKANMHRADVHEHETRRLTRVLVISKGKAGEVEKLLMEKGFEVVEVAPDFVVCYGGDGTILFAERKFPQIPKLIIKRLNVCRKCDYMTKDVDRVLQKIRNEEFKIQKKMKLVAEFKKRKLVGLNEIQVHNRLPIYAVRFSVTVDGKELDNLIGDGVIVATPFGSTGYYRSTGGEKFEKGIGVSFNNLHNKRIKSFVASEDSTVTIKVTRGPAWLMADNNENFLELKSKDVLTVKKSESTANIIYVPH